MPSVSGRISVGLQLEMAPEGFIPPLSNISIVGVYVK